MTNLLWPGDHRAGPLLSDAALWHAMVQVEDAWLRTLTDHALIPSDAAECDLNSLLGDTDLEAVALAADDGANPAIALVALLRRRAPEPTQRWIHRGLTSQDVLDSALMLALREAVGQLLIEFIDQMRALIELAGVHRQTAMVARTLTQHAIPIHFGTKAAGWLDSVCDAATKFRGLQTPIQIGGAAGTLAAATEIAASAHDPGHATQVALGLVDYTADVLGLDRRTPWHTGRGPITTIGDALVGCTDAWGRIASDVVTLNRPEIGELAEPAGLGRGGSSTMPDKRNPVLSVLLRRAALTGPPMAAALHTAAAFTNDERADGAWHAEWDTVRILGRRTLVAASHATELLTGLRVEAERMTTNLWAASVSGEQRAMAALLGKPPAEGYFGASDELVQRAIDRATQFLKDLS